MQFPNVLSKLILVLVSLTLAYGTAQAGDRFAAPVNGQAAQMPRFIRTGDASDNLVRAEEATHRWLDFRQIDRVAYSESFHFPNFRHNVSENYTETRVAPPLDILLVVDNSSTMAVHQMGMQDRLAELLSFVQAADWRIHVVTTDSTCPAMGTINSGDANYEQKFRSALNAGTNGDPNEQGIRMARQALDTPCGGMTWLRPNSALAILIISDEDNCSDHTGCQGDPWNDWQYLGDYLATIRALGTNVRVYGLIEDGDGVPSGCRDVPTHEYDTQYYNVIYRTGGICGSIEDSDYSTTLRKISQDTADLLPPPIILLGQYPTNGLVTVAVEGIILANSEFQVQGQSLILNSPIKTGQHLVVTYVYEDPYSKDFTLTNFAAPDSVMVRANGTALTPIDFTYNSGGKVVTINVLAQPNDRVEVDYRENRPLKTAFFIGPVQDVSTLHCLLADGTPMHSFIYDAGSQSIIFSIPPKELQLFKCSHTM